MDDKFHVLQQIALPSLSMMHVHEKNDRELNSTQTVDPTPVISQVYLEPQELIRIIEYLEEKGMALR